MDTSLNMMSVVDMGRMVDWLLLVLVVLWTCRMESDAQVMNGLRML